MIERQPSYARDNGQLSQFPTARQSPVRLARVTMRIWLYVSARLNQIVTGEELLDHAWDGKDRHGRKLDWNYPDKTIRNQHRHLVVGEIDQLRRSVHADGQYIIETCYEKRDGLEGYRCREITDEDIPQLIEKGYRGAANRRMADMAERAAFAAQSKRPALEAPQEPSPAPASSADEPDRPPEHHTQVVSPLFSQIGWPVDDEGRAFDGDAQLLEPVDVAGQDAPAAKLVERG